MTGMEGVTMSVEDLIGPLNEIERKYAPRQLWVVGDPSIFSEGRIVSVVGSRRPFPEGVRRTRRLVSELVRRDIAVLSGLALRRRHCGHEAAMQCGGRTVRCWARPWSRRHPGAMRGFNRHHERTCHHSSTPGSRPEVVLHVAHGAATSSSRRARAAARSTRGGRPFAWAVRSTFSSRPWTLQMLSGYTSSSSTAPRFSETTTSHVLDHSHASSNSNARA